MVKKKNLRTKKLIVEKFRFYIPIQNKLQANYHWAMSPALLYNLLTDEI